MTRNLEENPFHSCREIARQSGVDSTQERIKLTSAKVVDQPAQFSLDCLSSRLTILLSTRSVAMGNVNVISPLLSSLFVVLSPLRLVIVVVVQLRPLVVVVW